MTAVFLLALARCAGFVFRAPGFSHPSVPAPVRASFAFVLALAVAPSLHMKVRLDGVALVAAISLEAAIGAAIGIAASILYDGAYAGGRALDDYTGIRGSVPNAATYAPAGFGRIWSLVFTAGFFLLGGHRIALTAFLHVFALLPVGTIPSAESIFTYAQMLPAAILEAALLVAGPAMALVFVAQFALGAVARLTPRLGAFTLTFPIMFGAALLATAAAIPALFERSGVPWIALPFAHG